jgi:hypothetical protein
MVVMPPGGAAKKRQSEDGQLIGPGVIGGLSNNPPIVAPTLVEAGIDKNLAKRAR